jgi:hypothetical protein
MSARILNNRKKNAPKGADTLVFRDITPALETKSGMMFSKNAARLAVLIDTDNAPVLGDRGPARRGRAKHGTAHAERTYGN